MRPGPIRQLLRPGRLGISQVRAAKRRDENLGLSDLARGGVDDANALAGIVDKNLVARYMLTHHRRQSSLKAAKQIAKPAVAITIRMRRAISLPQDHHGDAGAF
jgi:hypothetical protein